MLDPVNLPEELWRVDMEFHDPTATDEQHRVFEAIAAGILKISIPGGLSDSGQKAAEDLEMFSKAAITDALLKVDGQNGWESIVDACCEGGAWAKVVPLWDSWSDVLGVRLANYKDDPGAGVYKGAKTRSQKYSADRENAKKQAGLPIAIVPVDARCVYPVWKGHQIVKVFEETWAPAQETMNEYGLSFDGSKFYESGTPMNQREAMLLGPNVRRIEEWTDTTCTIILATSAGSQYRVRQWNHGMGRQPYFTAPGIMRNYWKNRKIGWGVSTSKEGLVQLKTLLQTLLVQATAQEVGQPVIRKSGTIAQSIGGDSGAPKESEQWKLNTIVNVGPTEEFSAFPGAPPTIQAIQGLLTWVSAEIEKLNTPRIVGEIAGSGLQGAGFAMSQILTEARLKHGTFRRNLERFLYEITLFMWHLIADVIGERVYVYYEGPTGPSGSAGKWVSASPDEVKPAVRPRWSITIDQPSTLLMDSRYHDEQVKAGFESQDMAVEAQGRNPNEVRRGRILDELRVDPWYKELMKQKVVKEELGRGDLLRIAAEHAAQTGVLAGMDPNMLAQVLAGGMAGGGAGGVGGQGLPQDQAALAMAPQGGGVQPEGAAVPPQNRTAEQMAAASQAPVLM